MKNIFGFGVERLEIAFGMLMQPSEFSAVVLMSVEVGECIEGRFQLKHAPRSIEWVHIAFLPRLEE